MGSPARCLLTLWLVVTVTSAGCSDSSGPIRRLDGVDNGPAYDVAIARGHAYVADNDGVAIFDVEDPEHLVRTGAVAQDEAAFSVHVEGDLAFVGGGGRALTVVDVADPSQPVVLGAVDGAAAEGICTQGDDVFIGGLDGELAAIDVADPAAPRRVGELVGLGMIRDLWCGGDVVYAAVPDEGLRVIDASDPGSPVLLTTVPGTEGAFDLDIDGDLMFLGCHGAGVRILDVSEAEVPQVLSVFGREGEAWGVAAEGPLLWVANLQTGVEVYDVSDPKHPALVASDDRFAPHDVAFDGHVAYLADQDDGFVALELVASG